MLALKYLLLVGAIAMFIAALAVVAYDLYAEMKSRRGETSGITGYPEPLRWRTAVALVVVAWVPLLIALSIGLPSAQSLPRAKPRASSAPAL